MDEEIMEIGSDESVNLLNEGIYSQLGKEWYRKTRDETEKIRAILLEHLAVNVPECYSKITSPNLKIIANEDECRVRLVHPVEFFLFGEEPSSGFAKLKELNNPPQLCGRVFKVGEPTYSCRDCALDATCVFCNECFQKSVHKAHRYRMSASNGGCCDCGDVEAWKQDPACEVHQQGANTDAEDNPLDRLPPDLVDRATELFKVLLDYSVTFVNWDEYDKLPEKLNLERFSNNEYVTMLFNDETHTYDEVIRVLLKAVPGCTQTEAIQFASIVDREGRSILRCSDQVSCARSQEIIRKGTRRGERLPLRCEVMSTVLVAHQLVALFFMNWMYDISQASDGLRRLFCQLVTERTQDKPSVLDVVLQADASLWKVARAHTHQTFMHALLFDSYGKKQFATSFAKNYVQIYGEFVKDDHDQSISATSLSVQIFTVPTIAQMLVLEYDILDVILKTYRSYLKPAIFGKCYNFAKKKVPLRRISHMLSDLKYILQHKPEVWTNPLRQSFMTFVTELVAMLKTMTCMDPAKRRIVSVLEEHDSDWESAFNLQLRLMPILALVIDWCASDLEVLRGVFLLTLDGLLEVVGTNPTKQNHFPDVCPDMKLWDYKVSKKAVSVHLAISRFLAGLFTACNKYNLTLSSIIPHPYKIDVIELALRAVVFVAQVHAGMWRKNSYFVINQVYYYQSVRCRSEMYDRDIITLQVGAAILPNEYFVMAVLHKFELDDWCLTNIDGTIVEDEDVLRQRVVLAEECFHLLIIILSERYHDGIGKTNENDGIKREIIHRLCIGPMSHSELSKSLPLSDYDNDETADIDAVIASVSNFKRPGVNSRGLYELKDEFYSHYSPFFYHYNRIDQSKAEEQLRKHAKKNNLPKVTPPPDPPEFSEPFENAVNVLCSKTLVQALTNVLSRPMMDNSKSWSDTLIQQALHLVGLALHEETRQREKQSVGSAFDFITMARCENLLPNKPSLFETLDNLQGHRNVEEHASLLQWVLKKFNKEVSFREAKDHSPSTSDPNAEDLTCHKTAAMKKFDKEKRKKLAQERRAKVMEQMSAMQKAFIKENAELFAATDTASVSASGESLVDSGVSADAALQQAPVALGKHHSAPLQAVSEPVTCILCQEEQDVSIEGTRSVVLTAFVQRSSILSHVRTKKLENGEEFDPLFSPADLFWGIHSGSCGHTMHSDCWQRYFDSVLAKEGRGSRWQHYTAIDTSSHEFLCPLCKCLCNAVLPLFPPLIPSPSVSSSDGTAEQTDSSWSDILSSLQSVHSRMKVNLEKSDPMESLTFLNKTSEGIQTLYLRFKKGMKVSERNVEMIRLFAQSVYTVGLSVNPNESETRVPITSWSSCAYTIQTIECVLRSERKPIFGGVPSRQMEFLAFFVRYAATAGGQSSQNHVKQHCLRMLAATSLENIPGVEVPSIMDIDFFSYMVKLRSALPSLYFVSDPNSSSDISELNELSIDSLDQFVFQLSLAAFLVQVLLTTPEDLQLKDSEMGHDRVAVGDQGDMLAHLWATLRQFVGLQSKYPPHPSPWQLYCHVMNQLLPFLRCSALFYHCLTGVHTSPTPDGNGCSSKEYLDLCHFLNMSSSITDALSWDHAHLTISSPLVAKAARRWCSHSKIRSVLATVTAEPLGYGVTVSKLIDLPEDFSELINRASQFSCPNSSGDDSSRMPTLCLVCNEMLCSQSYCCQTTHFSQPVGACTAHVHKCGDGVGVFLRVRECQILLLSMTGRKKGCFVAPPYLDVYGEIDIGLRRGNPLYLCPERYNELQRLWSMHRIQETIAHSLELNRNLFSIDWAHF